MKRTEWMSCIVLGALVVYAVWNIAAVRYQLIRAESEREALSEQIAILREENRSLEQGIAQAEDAAVIEGMARTKLGLVYPEEIIFRVIQPETRERE